jgi:FHA domain-containing protein
MRPFTALERFFERLFERPSARLFHARLQPIQLQRRVERAMEDGRLSASDRIVVPNRYAVRLSPADLSAFGDLSADLEVELGEAALRFARSHGFAVADRPAVRLVPDPRVADGDARVDAAFSDAPAGSPSPGRPDAMAEPVAEPRGGIRGGRGRIRHRDAPPVVFQPTQTMVFQVPTIEAPKIVLREVAPDGEQRLRTMDGGPMTIGRATDNAIVLDDGRVSRYHARVQARQGALVFTDLGSTNGSRVNGVVVDEVVLGVGDRIELGDTVLVVEAQPGS